MTEAPVDREDQDPIGPDDPAVRRRPVEPIEWLALAVGLLPVVTAFVWALAVDWVPLGDSGQLTVRSRDVFTVDHPFVGAWSSRSTAIDGEINNLGSLQLVLLSPFTRLDPYWGSALGAAVLAAGAVTAVWTAARSVFGRLGAVGSMLATVALIASMGNVALLETRQQLAMLLPLWSLLWAAVALWRGRAWSAPLVVLAASLVVQTHFTFVLQAVALGAAGAIAFALGQRARWRAPGVRRPLLLAGAVALACWAPTMWDQFFGRGNLGQVAGQSGATGDRAGLGLGVELASDFTLSRPFWAPGSMGRLELGPPAREGLVQADWTSRLTIAAWALLTGATYVWARAGHRLGVAALAGVAGVALASAVVAATLIPTGAFMVYLPQNYYWLWPVGLLLALVPLSVVASSVLSVTASRADLQRVLGGCLVVGLLAAGLGGSVVTNRLGQLSKESFEQQVAGRSFVEQFAAALDAHRLQGRVLVKIEGRYSNSHRYLFLAELQRRGIAFTFPPGDGNLFRFGPRRCADRSIRHQITFSADADPARSRRPGSVILARINSSPTRRRHLARLDRQAADAMRSGAIAVDLDQVEPRVADDLRRVLRDPERSAAGLTDTVAFLASEGSSGIQVSDEAETLITDWRLASRRVEADQATLALTTRSGPLPGSCP